MLDEFKTKTSVAIVIVFGLKSAGYTLLRQALNLLAQNSDRTTLFMGNGLMPLAFLTKLSVMH